jgi:hypothetical protein
MLAKFRNLMETVSPASERRPDVRTRVVPGGPGRVAGAGGDVERRVALEAQTLSGLSEQLLRAILATRHGMGADPGVRAGEARKPRSLTATDNDVLNSIDVVLIPWFWETQVQVRRHRNVEWHLHDILCTTMSCMLLTAHVHVSCQCFH